MISLLVTQSWTPVNHEIIGLLINTSVILTVVVVIDCIAFVLILLSIYINISDLTA